MVYYQLVTKGEAPMATYTVHFDVREGSTCASPSATVEAESEYMAVQLAETKLKASYPAWRNRTWSPKRITKH